MANNNHPFGMRPLGRTETGGSPELRLYAAGSLPIFRWDPVVREGGGVKGPASGILPGANHYLGVAHGGIRGVTRYTSSFAEDTLLVEVSPDSLFEIQGDRSESSGREISPHTFGLNANLNFTIAGGGVLRDNSGVQLNVSTIARNSMLDVTVLSNLSDRIDRRIEVRFNNHLLKPRLAKA